MDKYAMMQKEAQEAAEGAFDKIKDFVGEGGSRIMDFWNSLGDDTKSTLVNSLIGAGIGGATTGAAGALSAGPNESSIGKGLSSGAVGALLGALAGGGGTAAYNLMSKSTPMPGERVEPRGKTLADTLVNTAWHNPLTTTGLAIGAAPAFGAIRPLEKAIDASMKRVRKRKVRGGISAAYKTMKNIPPTQRNVRGILHQLKKALGAGFAKTQMKNVRAGMPAAIKSLKGSKEGLITTLIRLSALPAGYIIGSAFDKHLKGE